MDGRSRCRGDGRRCGCLRGGLEGSQWISDDLVLKVSCLSYVQVRFTSLATKRPFCTRCGSGVHRRLEVFLASRNHRF